MNMTKILILALIGGVGGFLSPLLAQKLIDYKGKQKNKEMPQQPQYLSLLCKGVCAVSSMIGLGICGYFGASWMLSLVAAAIWILGMVVLLVDMRIRIIANETVIALFALGVLLRVGTAGLAGLPNSLLTTVVTMFIWISLARILGFGKVGAGDVKLSGVIGFMYGFPLIMGPAMVMAVGLLVFCLGGLLLRKLTRYSMFAMGPFLVIGMLYGLPYLFYILQ